MICIIPNMIASCHTTDNSWWKRLALPGSAACLFNCRLNKNTLSRLRITVLFRLSTRITYQPHSATHEATNVHLARHLIATDRRLLYHKVISTVMTTNGSNHIDIEHNQRSSAKHRLPAGQQIKGPTGQQANGPTVVIHK